MHARILIAAVCAGCLFAGTTQHMHGSQTNAVHKRPSTSGMPPTAPKTGREASPASARPIPFRGTVKEVDLPKQNFTIGKRTFHIGAKTKILKLGKPAALTQDIKGQWVTGSYRKSETELLEAISLYVGPKEAPASGQH